MARFKASRKDKEWFAERCGELLVKAFSGNISEVYDEVSQQHPDVPRKEFYPAFRTANPNNCQYAAKTYHPLYERGAEKNNLETANYKRALGYLEIDRQIRLQGVRKAIADAIIEGPISVIDSLGKISTIDPKLLDVFDKNHELRETRNQGRPSDSDDGSRVEELDNAFERAEEEARDDTE
ncbi:MAG: hypothetical protein OXN27_04375 [Candidatus Poribacteria bacterium]|nr:hypothetical protein [Candidatus Poribacteria bacterium]